MVRIGYNEGSNLHLHLDSKGTLYLNPPYLSVNGRKLEKTVLCRVHWSAAVKVWHLVWSLSYTAL